MRKFGLAASVGITAAMAMLLAGCGASANTSPSTTTQSSGPLTVWVDAPRVSAVKAFEKAYPNIPVKMNLISTTVTNSQLEAQIQLFNKSGSGWPDVLWFSSLSNISWAASPTINYAANLTNLVPKSVVNGYNHDAIAACEIGGQLRCLRNDYAPTVLWYNAKLFHEWGYSPPKTWPQYEALGLEIAKQHPGYYVGAVGDGATYNYLWASACPVNTLVRSTTVKINLTSPNCTRMVNVLDPLIKAGVLSKSPWFSSQMDAIGSKMVMTPGPTWFGVYLYKDSFHTPAGQITATVPITWPGQDITGDYGGGLWTVSSHLSGKLLQEAVKFAEFVATSPKNQVDLAPTFPAYGPDEGPWLQKNVVDSNYFADPGSIVNAFKKSVGMVWTGHPYLKFSPDQIWATTVTPALDRGESLQQIWPTYQKALVNYAQEYGYSVVTN